MDGEYNLKKTLREVFPDLLEEFGSCKTQEEKDEVLKKCLLTYANKLKPSLPEAAAEEKLIPPPPAFLLEPVMQKKLDSAQGNLIKEEILYILARLALVVCGDENGKAVAGKVASLVYYAGLLALGEKATKAAIQSLRGGAGEKEAALAGIEAAGAPEICSLAALIAIRIAPPIIITLPNAVESHQSRGTLLLINNMGNELVIVDEWISPGTETRFTPKIPGIESVFKGLGQYKKYSSSGFIYAETNIPKFTPIEYGFTYGITYKAGNHTFQLAFGVPLNGTQNDNNCYCAIDSTSEQAAKETSIKKKQAYNVTTDDGFINVDIKVNSGYGRNAFFIASISELLLCKEQ